MPKSSVTDVFSEPNQNRSSIGAVSDQYTHICIRPAWIACLRDVFVELIQSCRTDTDTIYSSVLDQLPKRCVAFLGRVLIQNAGFCCVEWHSTIYGETISTWNGVNGNLSQTILHSAFYCNNYNKVFVKIKLKAKFSRRSLLTSLLQMSGWHAKIIHSEFWGRQFARVGVSRYLFTVKVSFECVE